MGNIWTGPLDRLCFGPFFWTNFWTILLGEAKPSVLKEGCSLSLQYLGRGGRQVVVTKGGVEDELSVRREGLKVVVLVNVTD